MTKQGTMSKRVKSFFIKYLYYDPTGVTVTMTLGLAGDPITTLAAMVGKLKTVALAA
jgi:hypothetical protein